MHRCMQPWCPRALGPCSSWILGDVLTKLDTLQATHCNTQPTSLKQTPEASTDSVRSKAFVFVMRVEEENDTEKEEGNSDEDARALVTAGAKFSCNDLECSSTPYNLTGKRSLEKILLELEYKHHLKIQCRSTR